MEYTVHGILQARLLEWVAVPLSRGSSQPRDQTQVSRIAGGFFTGWAQSQNQCTTEQILTRWDITLLTKFYQVKGMVFLVVMYRCENWTIKKAEYQRIDAFELWCCRPVFDPWVGKIPWRRERLPTPVFWPGEFHGLYSPWGSKDSDMTERLSLHFTSPL